jgi:YD repeat-containing protein
LTKKKVCARFVPHLLTPDQIHQHAALLSVEFAEMIYDDGNVLKRIVTGGESWCFMYDPERKLQSATS